MDFVAVLFSDMMGGGSGVGRENNSPIELDSDDCGACFGEVFFDGLI